MKDVEPDVARLADGRLVVRAHRIDEVVHMPRLHMDVDEGDEHARPPSQPGWLGWRSPDRYASGSLMNAVRQPTEQNA